VIPARPAQAAARRRPLHHRPRRWRGHPQVWVAVLLTLVAVGLLPAARSPAVPVPELVPMAAVVVTVADLLCAVLLLQEFVWGAHDPRTAGLAGTFVFSGCFVVPALAIVPGLAGSAPLLRVPLVATVWMRLVWQGGAALGLLLCLGLPDHLWVHLESTQVPGRRGPVRVSPGVVVVPAGLVAAETLGIVVAARADPTALIRGSFAGLGQLVGLVLVAALLALAPVVLRRRHQLTSLQRWSMVSVAGTVPTLILLAASGARATVGWDASWVLWAVTECLVAAAVLREMLEAGRLAVVRGDLERQTIARVLAGLAPAASAGEAAEAVCAAFSRLRDLAVVTLMRCEANGEVVPLAAWPPAHPVAPIEVGVPLPPARARHLAERAREGPFVERIERSPEGTTELGDYLAGLHRAGLRASVHAPVTIEGRLAGIFSAGAAGATPAAALAAASDSLPALTELAAVAGVALASALRSGPVTVAERHLVLDELRRREFHAIFQPVVTLVGGTVIGHEALTRFDDKGSPQGHFERAAAADLAVPLELACVREAISAARRLPRAHGWLSVNVSPAVLLEATRPLAAELRGAERPVVLELTEHVVIDDYARVRRALSELGPSIRLAVDDAGAGFASLRHILELRPAFVKLDRSLVHGVDEDLVRHALVAGLIAFASRAGCQLIAEGIESSEELQALAELGVPLGQGYLFGAGAAPALEAGSAGPSAVKAQRSG